MEVMVIPSSHQISPNLLCSKNQVKSVSCNVHWTHGALKQPHDYHGEHEYMNGTQQNGSSMVIDFSKTISSTKCKN